MPLPKPLSEVKEDIRAFVGESEHLKALQYLQELLPQNSGKRNQASLIQASLSLANQKHHTNQIKYEDYGVELSKVGAAILEIVAGLLESDFVAQATVMPVISAIPKFVVIYHELDKPFFEGLKKQLIVLERFKKLRIVDVNWGAGNLEESAKTEIVDADYLLVLLTPQLFIPDPIDWLDLVFKALGDGRRMIPLRIQKLPDEVPELEKLKSLPSMGRWVSDMPNQDTAYAEIVGELRKLLPK